MEGNFPALHKAKAKTGFARPKYIKPPSNAELIYFMGDILTEEQLLANKPTKIKIKVGKTETPESLWNRKGIHEWRGGVRIPMKILAVLWGLPSDEKYLKTYFGDGKINGVSRSASEWLKYSREIEDYLRLLRQQPYVLSHVKGKRNANDVRRLNKLNFVPSNIWLPPCKGPSVNSGFFMSYKHGAEFEELDTDRITDGDYYSPNTYTKGATDVMGVIDLDPASCKTANYGDVVHRGVRATQYYGVGQDGLRLPWYRRVFLNPPFSQWERWGRKIIEELDSGRMEEICIVVGAGNLDVGGLKKVRNRLDAIFIPDGRGHSQFWGPKSTSSMQAHYLLYIGPNAKIFHEVFSQYGNVYGPMRKR